MRPRHAGQGPRFPPLLWPACHATRGGVKPCRPATRAGGENNSCSARERKRLERTPRPARTRPGPWTRPPQPVSSFARGPHPSRARAPGSRCSSRCRVCAAPLLAATAETATAAAFGAAPGIDPQLTRALVRGTPRSTATGASPVPAPAGGRRSPQRICPRRARPTPADCPARWIGIPVSLAQPLIEAAQQGTTAGERDTAVHDVAGQLGRALVERGLDDVHDGADGSLRSRAGPPRRRSRWSSASR